MRFLRTLMGKSIFALLLLISVNGSLKAQTTLVAGDIAFTGYISAGTTTDEFSFVLLKAVTLGTTINFTDNAWLNTGSLRTGEQTVTWTAAAGLAAGTEIKISGPGAGAATATFVGGGSAGTCTGLMPSLSTSGDQVLAYQGTAAAPTFISAIHMNVYAVSNGDPVNTDAATWDNTNSNNTSASALPPGLTTGTTAIWVGVANTPASEFDNAIFNCASGAIGTLAQVKALIYDPNNWTKTNGAPVLPMATPTGCNYLGALSAPSFTTNPSAASVCAGVNSSFSVVATNASSYQWQVDNGGGFANVTDNGTYSGATTATLNITATPGSFNGFIYRCVATNGVGSTNSGTATLTVTPLPVNPTLLVKTPAAGTVADGTPVSATFNAGSGGTGCSDDFRYTTNGGLSYLPYTPGSNISTTGLAAGTGMVFIEGRRNNCSSGCANNYVVLASWVVTPLPAGATTLNAGDIAFTGYTSTTAGDDFSFVLLRNIGPGTTINFTDNGWLSTNALQTAESTLQWTSNTAYSAGTEIKISGLTATLAAGGSAGTVTGTALSLSTSGDQILAYRGSAAAPTFISAIHMNVYSTLFGDPVSTTAAAWDGTANTTSSSALPTGLTTGVNCIWIGTQDVPASEFANSRYGNCGGPGTLGPISTLRATLNNQANWISDNNTPPSFTLPTGCLYLGVGSVPNISTNPTNATVCEGVNSSFSIVAGGALTYQWQVDPGTGFVNVTDNAIYSGATTATLSINATPLSLNGGIYRCIASNVSGSSTSTTATLTVNALPVTPTLLAKTPTGITVADGTPVSATFNAGSGGTGCADDYRYTTDGGVTYLPYTPGSNISTTGVAAGSGFVFIEGRRANCSAGCQGTYTVLAMWRVTPIPVAATTLNAGDIAFSSYTSTNAVDEFSFVLLKNVGPGTAINFTDNGWLSTNVLQTAEQTITWTAPAGGLPGGTEIKIAGLTATRSGGGAAGTVTGTALSISTSGDQILAYRGTAASPTFISAIHMNVYSVANGDPVTTTAAAWDGTANTQSSSALPTGLTTGVNCIWIGTQGVISSEHNNAKYGNCNAPAIGGSLVALRALLNNQANWITDDNTPPAFATLTGCNYLSVLCPTITVSNPATTTGTAGTAFSQTFTSTGGVPTITYSTLSTLPTGLTLSSAGVLSGTPTQSGTFPIVVTATDGGGCTGNGATYTLVIGCPANIVTATPSSQTICSGSAITNIVLSGGLPTSTYNWTRDNNASVTGIASNGTGDISGSLTNTTSAPVTVTFTITPVIYGCNGTPTTATVLVNPTPDAVATPASQSVCNGATITTIALTGAVTGTQFNWTRDNTGTVTGIAASGSGDISGALTNSTNAPVTVTFTITPTANGCPGTPVTATVVVNPIPDATATPASQARCSGAGIQPIVISGNVSGTTFNWTRDQVGIIGGSIPANGSGNITGSLVNNTGSPVTVTFTITPTANGCPGTPITATVTVNPLPLATIIGGSQSAVCQGNNHTLSAVTNPGYTYAWGYSLFTNPFTPVGTDSVQDAEKSGTYLLTVTNQYGCTDTAMTYSNVADYEFVGSLATGDAVQTGRLNRFAAISTCGAPKGCPGTFTTVGSRLYDSYTITNPRNVPVCATIGVNSQCGTSTFSVAYLGSFNPANLCANYLADPGSSFTLSGFYEATIPANGTIVVVIHEVNPGTGCASYRLSVAVPRDSLGIIVTPDSAICSSQTATLTAPVANSYSWTPGGATTRSITTTTPGLYTVNLGYGNHGCNISTSKTILVSAAPDVATVNNQTACLGSTVNIPFTGSVPGTTYSWTNTNTAIGLGASGNGDLNFVATNATAAPISGTITVTPTNGSCTGTPKTFTITVLQQPNITSVTNDSVCAPGGVVNLSASGNGIINWFDSATGGHLVNTGTTYSPNITATTSFFVESVVYGAAPSLLAMPAQSNTFPGNVRGYWFTAPNDFVITSLSIPTTASSGPQNIAVLKFNNNTPPPVFSGTTNAFTTLYLTRLNTTTGKIPVNIPVHQGEVIGILGERGGINSYAPGDYVTSINGSPVQLERLGMQFPLETTNPQNVWREFGATTSISRIEFEYAPASCPSSPRVEVKGVIKPLPIPTATPSSQTICSGSAITTIVLAPGTAAPTTYSWTRDNTATVTGIAASGTTNISGTLTNTTNAPVTVTFTITASAVGGCTSAPITATVVVNPTSTVNAVSNQVVCNGGSTAAVTFSSPTTGGSIVYNWTNNTPSIGLAGSGSGNIGSFVATNATNAPVTATITVTPSYTNNSVTCVGTPRTFTITVNPTATVNTVSNQVVCNGGSTAAVTFSSPTTGGSIVYNWTNNTTSIGLAGSGTGNIGSFVGTNATNAPVTATITVTPSYTNGAVTCVGTPSTFTITVNPTATVNTVSNQVVCNGGSTAAVTFSSPTTGGSIVYNWTNNTPSIGLVGSGSGNIGSFVATNATNAPVTATITVTPSYTNGGVTCVGTPTTFTITVNPTATVNTVSNQVVCNGGSTAAVTFTSPTSGGSIVYNWTNNTTSIGLAGSGTGNIGSFVGTNATNAPVTATITVTASYTNGGVTCVGTPTTFTITVNPVAKVNTVSDQVLCNGSNTAAVNFTSPTTGGTITYNWTNNITAIGLGTSGSGNIPSFLATNNGVTPLVATITVTPAITNGGITCYGTPSSFTITVNPTPNVNAVNNQVLCNGSGTTAVNFTGAVTGTAYSWTNNNTSIGLGASGTGDIASFTATNATNAPVTATITVTPSYTNAGSTCTGAPITFTITVNPTPTVNAVSNQTVCNGSGTTAVTFSGAVTGTVYNWTNSTPSIGLAPSGTGNIGSFTGINATNAPVTATITVTPSYTNGGTTCTGTPRTFTITVNPTPTVVAVGNQTVCNGSATTAVTFNGAVAGTLFNWTNNTPSIGLIASGTGNIASFTAVNTGTTPVTATITVTPSYTNGGTTCTGTPITFSITVNPSTAISANPTNVTICEGNNASFTVGATGVGLTYQWQVNTGSGFNNIIGATLATYTITGAPALMNGYQYRCVVTGTCGSATSTAATLTVNTAPVVTANPVNVTVCAGNNASFSVTATGTGLTYQWQVDNGTGFANIGGATNATLNLTGVTAAQNGFKYRCVVSGTCPPTATSTAATLTVNIPVSFTTQPASVSICFGLNASFSVVATGTGPLTYQWQVNNGSGFVNIPGETAPTLSLVLPQLGFSLNQYRCVVTGACGPVNSNAATLIVFSLPNIFANNPTRVCLSDTIVTLKATPAGGTWSGRGVTGDKFSATAAGLGVSSLTYTYVNANGCISIFNHNITVNDCKERHNRLENGVLVFPNPSNGQVKVRFLSDLYNDLNIRVTTIQGQQMASAHFSGLLYGSEISLDLRHLAAGTYILQAYNGSDMGSFRIVIVH